mgnify:FL=1|jgi:hypothetical protein
MEDKMKKKSFSIKHFMNDNFTNDKVQRLRYQTKQASLTVEASLILPLFIYFFLFFIYFIQIFTLQERIQSALTRMGLDLAKVAYLYHEFQTTEEAQNLDQTVFEIGSEIGLLEMVDSSVNKALLKLLFRKYVGEDQINDSHIQGGFRGLNFSYSKVLDDQDQIDIIVSYPIRIPIQLFGTKEMNIIQRIQLRAWTGHKVEPAYSTVEEGESEDSYVYITKTGTVYHKNRECSHIKLSVRSVKGIPSELRNNHGGKYYPCEKCCNGKESITATFYITSDGTRYHSKNDCPKIKRTVLEIPLSEADNRTPCRRCGK